MTTSRVNKATATGLVFMMIFVDAGVSTTSGFALLLSFAGVLAASILIFIGVRMADNDPATTTGRSGVLAAGELCLRRNLSLVGLLLASAAASATTAAAADRETAQVLCFCAFTLLLFALTLVNIGVLVLGEQQQGH